MSKYKLYMEYIFTVNEALLNFLCFFFFYQYCGSLTIQFIAQLNKTYTKL